MIQPSVASQALGGLNETPAARLRPAAPQRAPDEAGGSSAEAGWDELLDASGRLRAPWRRLLGTLLGLGTAALRERRRELDRALADDGPDPLSAGGAWRCDPVPFLLDAAEFAALEAGLAQRARLLQALLHDLYGGGRAIAAGLLPPALVFGNPAYLHPCRFSLAPDLRFYAADLRRAPDGAWQVVADHTEAPCGLGRALLNRRMMARVLPELFRSLDPAPLPPAMQAWRQALRPAPDAELALLSRGSEHAAWFDTLRLARELGVTLVEAGDLTARQGRLWLKTLRGLRRVDMLLGEAGVEIDPLELPGRALCGVPGLLAAMRGGFVQVPNGPGAAIAGAPALAAFLPQLCRHMLDQTLALASVETLWLGDEDARRRVAAEPGWRIGSAFASGPEAARGAAPWESAAAKPAPPSFAPGAGEGETLARQPIELRLFLLREAGEWRALPGGLAWLAAAPATGKDVWVLQERRVEPGGAAHFAPPARLARGAPGDLPSRAADNFYWFGRYLERLETAARLSRALLSRLGRESLAPPDLPELAALGFCLVQAAVLSPEAAAAGPALLAHALEAALAHDQGAVAGVKREVQRLGEVLRDRLSAEMHAAIVHGIRRLEAARARIAARPHQAGPALADYAAGIVEACATISGYVMENMVRGGGRLFLDLGRRVERAQATAMTLARLVEHLSGRPEAALGIALELCDSRLAYQARYLGAPQPAPVLDLLLADEDNPRSLGFQLATARTLLARLGEGEGAAAAPIAACRAAAERADIAALPGELRAIAAQIGALSDALSRRYFAILPVTWTGTQR